MSRLRLATVNVNGIRAAFRKGMGEWLSSRDVDVLAMQEVRATDDDVAALLGDDWTVLHHPATTKGRAGVAVAFRVGGHVAGADVHRVALGPDDFDSAGRWLEADLDVDGTLVTVVSAYVHSGEADTPKQVEKWKFLDAMAERLPELRAHNPLAVVVGDLNVGHDERDIKNWKGNVRRAGFLPRERAYLDRFLGADGEPVTAVDGSTGTGLGWVDVGRAQAGDVDGPYTWWSWRGKAFDNDSGWRIDYQLATPDLAATVSQHVVDRAASYDTRWSDHTPVVVDYSL
ncbi:exodeoxyribonuclease III [Curtobacterium sp. RRHDQ10]|uniref:exodeoxyribonuclease III n=1 Tax=Curtobacterium phyllosphaerae TaxID=3413379 RepID=UPI003BEF8721